MDISVLLQATINGLLIGGVYSLVAVGLTLIFGVSRIINFAHGEFLMLGMYLAYYVNAKLGLSPYISVLICIPLFMALGAVVQTVLVNPVMKGPQDIQILLTVALALFLQNAALRFFYPTVRGLSIRSSTYSLSVGNTLISFPRLAASIAAIGMILALYSLLRYTGIGKAIRACSEDREGAFLAGINVGRIFAVAFGIGIACAGIAGALIAPFYPLSPFTGTVFTLTAFVVVVLGGMGDFLGALFGGFLIGVCESLAAIFIPASLKQVVSFGLFVLILLFRPSGLFGRKREWLTV